MAKFTDAITATLKTYFEAGDQPTAAQFAEWIDACQQGIEEHDHSGTGDGDGVSDLVGPLTGAGLDVPDGWYLGIGAALERIVFNAAGNVSVMGASFFIDAGRTLAGGSVFVSPVSDFEVQGNYGSLTVVRTTANVASAKLTAMKSRAAGVITSGDELFAFEGIGHDGGDYGTVGARIVFKSTGVIAADKIPTNIEFWTAEGALANDVALKMTLSNTGTLTIVDLGGGGNQDVGADNNGLLYVPFVSDRKFKDHIEPLTGGLDVVRQLRGVTFDWNKDALAVIGLDFGECGQQAGLIAQEVVEAIPLAANKGKKYDSYRKETITPYLIEAIKELDTRLTKGGL